MELIPDILEAIMILCFGISWPLSIIKSLKSRTAKGKSVSFAYFIWTGYIFGLARKFLQYSISADHNWVFYMGWIFYVLNLLTVSVDILLYYRNRSLDKNAAPEKART